MKTLNLFFIPLLLLVASCSHSLVVEDFVAWHQDEENGLYRETTEGNYRFQLQYRPHELVALSNSSDRSAIDPTAFEEEVQELKDYQFYNLRISAVDHPNFLKAHLASQEEYYQRIAYYSSFAQPDFRLVENHDTLNCTMYHFERNYGMKPYHTVLLGFKNTPGEETTDRTLIYEDRVLGIAPVQLQINGENLKHIPKLRL